MSFTYTRDIPDGPHNPSADQGPMKQNTNSIDDIISVNHYSFGESAPIPNSDGKHKYIELPSLSTIPGGLVASEGTIYTKPTIHADMFYTNGTSGNEYQLTSVSNANFATFATNPGWTFLPGGLLMQWGSNAVSTGTSVSFSRNFTGAPYSVQCTLFVNNNNRHFITVKTVAAGSFTVASRDSSGNDENNTIFWVAIGSA